MVKEVILKFDFIKKEFDQNLKDQTQRLADPDAEPPGEEMVVSPGEISMVRFILAQIRYVLMKFGRTINYLEKLNVGFNKFQQNILNNQRGNSMNLNQTVVGNSFNA